MVRLRGYTYRLTDGDELVVVDRCAVALVFAAGWLRFLLGSGGFLGGMDAFGDFLEGFVDEGGEVVGRA